MEIIGVVMKESKLKHEYYEYFKEKKRSKGFKKNIKRKGYRCKV